MKLAQIWVSGVPKGSLLVEVDGEQKELGERCRASERVLRARWAHQLARSSEVESPGVPHSSANVLKKYKESPSVVSSFAALAPLGDGVHASDFHQSSIK